MNKTGYDQFFKAARAAARPGASKVGRKPGAPPAQDKEAGLRKALNVKKKKNSPFPVKPLVFGVLLIGAGLFYITKPDLIDGLLRRVEVRFIGQVAAEETPGTEKAATSGSDRTAKAAAGEGPSSSASAGTKDKVVSEDLSYIEKLRVRKEELDLREKELNQLEEELQRQKVEVDQRVRQLEQIGRIATVLKDRVAKDDTQISKLVDCTGA